VLRARLVFQVPSSFRNSAHGDKDARAWVVTPTVAEMFKDWYVVGVSARLRGSTAMYYCSVHTRLARKETRRPPFSPAVTPTCGLWRAVTLMCFLIRTGARMTTFFEIERGGTIREASFITYIFNTKIHIILRMYVFDRCFSFGLPLDPLNFRREALTTHNYR
jgi:hypothetical protein